MARLRSAHELSNISWALPHATAGWQTFETTLDETIVRDYLAYPPDFAEFEALDRAFAHAARYLARLDALAVRVEPGSGLTDHATYPLR